MEPGSWKIVYIPQYRKMKKITHLLSDPPYYNKFEWCELWSKNLCCCDLLTQFVHIFYTHPFWNICFWLCLHLKCVCKTKIIGYKITQLRLKCIEYLLSSVVASILPHKVQWLVLTKFVPNKSIWQFRPNKKYF